MIPDINRKEWKAIITGDVLYKFSSFSFQMKVNTLSQSYKSGFIKLDDAVRDLHSLCVKYERIYSNDLNKIFK